MAKVQIKSEQITPSCGIFSIMEQFDTLSSKVIDSTLGVRCQSFGYIHSEMVHPNPTHMHFLLRYKWLFLARSIHAKNYRKLPHKWLLQPPESVLTKTNSENKNCYQ